MNVRISEGWGRMLREEFDKDYFTSLTDFVRTEYKTYRVYPPAAKIFSAFDTCPFENTKVVIIGQDPYHGYGQAHGLCFSVNDGVPFPPSLRNIFIEIQNETGRPLGTAGSAVAKRHSDSTRSLSRLASGQRLGTVYRQRNRNGIEEKK